MKIAIDISPLEGDHRFRGIGTYTQQLVDALTKVDDGNEYVLTTKPTSREVDLVHYPYFDFFFLTLPRLRKVPTVVTVHDAIPLVYPEHYPPGLRGKFKYLIQHKALKSVEAIVTDSNVSKNDVVKLMGIDERKVHRVYLAAANKITPIKRPDYAAIMKKYDISRPYLLYVGDINYNKNIDGLIEAYRSVTDKVDLVMVSKAMEGSSIEAQTLKNLIKTIGLDDNIHILTNVAYDPPTDLCALYSSASWYVQPSFYEGFGLPVLEAMQCKTPVISSIGGSLKEIAGEAAIMFDPNEKGALTRVLKTALGIDAGKRQVLIEKGIKQARKFDWEKTAKETIRVYRQVLV